MKHSAFVSLMSACAHGRRSTLAFYTVFEQPWISDTANRVPAGSFAHGSWLRAAGQMIGHMVGLQGGKVGVALSFRSLQDGPS